MSMEEAILELAAAMREQAAAQRESNEVQRATAAGYERAVTAYATGEQRAKEEPTDKKADSEGAKKIKAEVVQPDAELEAAVTQVEEEAKALDYTKDVRPVLLAVNKKAGQPALKALLAEFGAASGDKLKPEQFVEIVAAANKILAG